MLLNIRDTENHNSYNRQNMKTHKYVDTDSLNTLNILIVDCFIFLTGVST